MQTAAQVWAELKDYIHFPSGDKTKAALIAAMDEAHGVAHGVAQKVEKAAPEVMAVAAMVPQLSPLVPIVKAVEGLAAAVDVLLEAHNGDPATHTELADQVQELQTAVAAVKGLASAVRAATGK